MATTRKMTMGLLAVAALALSASVGFAAGEFAGTWKVKDTGGKDFNITLGADGTATSDRAAKPMKGTWKEDGGAAVITWDTGWITKIAKEGTGYKKTAYKKDATGTPKNSTDAEKVK
jgi:hypothetical protein